jgi:hypothetical protein
MEVEYCEPLSVQDPELASVLTEFQASYQKFAKQYPGRLVRIAGQDIASAIQGDALNSDIRHSALTFESKLRDILAAIHNTRQIRAARWTGKFTRFLSRLLPLAITCFRLTSAVTEVY